MITFMLTCDAPECAAVAEGSADDCYIGGNPSGIIVDGVAVPPEGWSWSTEPTGTSTYCPDHEQVNA